MKPRQGYVIINDDFIPDNILPSVTTLHFNLIVTAALLQQIPPHIKHIIIPNRVSIAEQHDTTNILSFVPPTVCSVLSLSSKHKLVRSSQSGRFRYKKIAI